MLVDLEHLYLIVEHYPRTVIPTPGYSLVLASRLTNESMAYRGAFTCTWLPSQTYLIASPGGLAMIHIPRPLSRPVFADGGRLSGHSHHPHRSFSPLPRVPWSPTASLGPRNTFSLRVSRLVRLLLGALFPVPSLWCFSPYIRDGRHCGWHGAPRFLSSVRFWGVGWTLLLVCWLRSFLLLVFHPALPFFLGIAVLADAFTAFAIVSHPQHIQIFYFTAQSALYAASNGLFSNSLTCANTSQLNPTAMPVDRSLVMRALGGAITSPCSNDTESRRPTPTIFGLFPQLLFNCWMLLDSPIQITALSGRLLIVFCVHSWLVQLPLYYRIICIEFFC